MNVGRHVQGASVPAITVALLWRVVGDKVPVFEVFEQRRLILDEQTDVHVGMVPTLTSQPGVDRPAADQKPGPAELVQQVREASNVAGSRIGHARAKTVIGRSKPLTEWLPRSSNFRPLPSTRLRVSSDVSTSDAPASAMIRAAAWTATP